MRLSFATLVLALAPAPALAADLAVDLEAAEAHYRAGRYAAALAELTREIDASRDPDARVLYDAGNCAYRLGRYAESALFFRRALKRDPSDAQARFNLRLAEKKLGVPPPASEPFLQSLRGIVDAAGPASLALAAAALESAALACLVFGRRRRAARAAGAILLVAGLATAAAFARRAWPSRASEGYVLAREARVYAEPRDDLPVVMTLKIGEVVELGEATERWVKLRAAGRDGWTPSANVGRID